MEGIKNNFFFSVVLTMMKFMQIHCSGIKATLDSSKSNLASIDVDFQQSRVFMFKNLFKSIKIVS